MKIKESVGGLKRYKTYAQIFTSCILYNGCIWFFAANKHVILSLQSLMQFSNLNVYQGFEMGVFISNNRQSYMNHISLPFCLNNYIAYFTVYSTI